jgi:Flp pilus assembly pilin Flp
MTHLTSLYVRLLGGLDAGRSRRGATLIEYMLLAAIAIVLAFAIRAGLTGQFGDILDRIGNALRT